MIDPIGKAVKGSESAFSKLPTSMAGISSQTNNAGRSAGMSTNTTANSNMNFNIANVSAGDTGGMQGKQMKEYIEGISVQVATKLLRQNQGYGGLI
jgi:hypothetical protein